MARKHLRDAPTSTKHTHLWQSASKTHPHTQTQRSESPRRMTILRKTQHTPQQQSGLQLSKQPGLPHRTLRQLFLDLRVCVWRFIAAKKPPSEALCYWQNNKMRVHVRKCPGQAEGGGAPVCSDRTEIDNSPHPSPPLPSSDGSKKCRHSEGDEEEINFHFPIDWHRQFDDPPLTREEEEEGEQEEEGK